MELVALSNLSGFHPGWVRSLAMRRKVCSTASLLMLTLGILCMWTYWVREPKAAVVSDRPLSGIAIAAQEIFSYASWADRDFARGELVQLSLRLPSEKTGFLGMTVHVRTENGTRVRVYVFEDLQFLKEENGTIFFAVKQKNEMYLARSD